MPFNMESNEKGGVKKIAVSFYEFIKQFDKLDISPIEGFLSEWYNKKEKDDKNGKVQL